MKIQLTKRAKIIIGVIGLIALLTNPGKLQLDAGELNSIPLLDKDGNELQYSHYFNLLLLSVGNQVHMDPDSFTYKVTYIGIFQNYFSVLTGNNELHFKIVSNP